MLYTIFILFSIEFYFPLALYSWVCFSFDHNPFDIYNRQTTVTATAAAATHNTLQCDLYRMKNETLLLLFFYVYIQIYIHLCTACVYVCPCVYAYTIYFFYFQFYTLCIHGAKRIAVKSGYIISKDFARANTSVMLFFISTVGNRERARESPIYFGYCL